MELIDFDSRNPARQPSAPRTHWTKEVKAFQCAEFAVTVIYWLCENHYDGRLHIEIVNFRVTWYDKDEPQPPDEVVREIAEDMLRDYYSDAKIVFE